jgi:hypothetical protein
LACNCQAVITQRRPDAPGLVSYMFQLNAGYWHSYTRADLVSKPGAIGVGLGESRRQVDYTFDPPHGLVCGTTGSGKTETMRTILCGLFTTFSPNELNAVIVDPNGDYGDFTNVAHLGGLPVARDPQDIDDVLTYADQELARRKGNNWRDKARLVVAVDEGEDCLTGTRLTIAQGIARTGRAFGVSLLVSTQKPTQKALPDLVDKLNNRWVGLVDNAGTSVVLTGQAGLECHKLTGKGDFVRVAGADQERLQVARATRGDLDALPRADIEPPVIEEDDTPRGLNTPDEPGGPGRPALIPDPEAVAHYLWYGEALSIAKAAEVLGLSKRGHYLNRDFAAKVRETLDKIREVKR